MQQGTEVLVRNSATRVVHGASKCSFQMFCEDLHANAGRLNDHTPSIASQLASCLHQCSRIITLPYCCYQYEKLRASRGGRACKGL
jgi:hypothetical protein